MKNRSRGNLTASVSVEGHRRLGCEGESPYFHPPVPVSRIDSEFQRRRGKSQTRTMANLASHKLAQQGVDECFHEESSLGFVKRRRWHRQPFSVVAGVASGPLEAFSRTPSAELADAPFHCPPSNSD